MRTEFGVKGGFLGRSECWNTPEKLAVVQVREKWMMGG